jgi:hypothetical protein
VSLTEKRPAIKYTLVAFIDELRENVCIASVLTIISLLASSRTKDGLARFSRARELSEHNLHRGARLQEGKFDRVLSVNIDC